MKFAEAPHLNPRTSSSEMPKLIAFHLPQFHRIPQNDAWWGEGFTEWTNVKKSLPRYRGHQQPSVPLGGHYYDLSDPSAREWQAHIARHFGIGGFCYYHYWFRGQQLLQKPCEEILASGKPDFPFCFSWANETWTRTWDGGTRSVLMQQDYGVEDDWRDHFNYLLPFFRDPRYITHHGCPLFLIYRSHLIPNLAEMITCWNRWAIAEGLLGISFVKTLTCFDARPARTPFSASVHFEPWLTSRRHTPIHRRLDLLKQRGVIRLANYFGCNRTFVHSYDEIWRDILRRSYGVNDFPGAFVGWDNTPRLGPRSLIVAGSSPEKFGTFMHRLLKIAIRDGSPFVFVNAWNEWAEGAYLEPDERHGYAYLECLAAAINSCKSTLPQHS